jgi:hypothetical protein
VVLMPLPGSRIIPNGWSEHHRPTATATLNGSCVIDRPGAPASLDPATLQYGAAASTRIWAGPCRVQALARAQAKAGFAELDLTTKHYQVVVEWQAVVQVQDVVTVTDADDPTLVGRKMRVLDVSVGTEQWERDLIAEDWEG